MARSALTWTATSSWLRASTVTCCTKTGPRVRPMTYLVSPRVSVPGQGVPHDAVVAACAQQNPSGGGGRLRVCMANAGIRFASDLHRRLVEVLGERGPSETQAAIRADRIETKSDVIGAEPHIVRIVLLGWVICLSLPFSMAAGQRVASSLPNLPKQRL